nr:hypothetical protein [Tanacetum cinerariifolium]
VGTVGILNGHDGNHLNHHARNIVTPRKAVAQAVLNIGVVDGAPNFQPLLHLVVYCQAGLVALLVGVANDAVRIGIVQKQPV